MRKLVVVLGAVMQALLTAGCSPQRVVNALTPTDGYTVDVDRAYGQAPRQRLDVYAPTDAQGDAPVVVFFYGGRWTSGSKSGYPFLAEALTSLGYVAVVADYRLYPQVKFPAFVEDGAQAVGWVRREIAAYGGDPQRLYVMGHSAGAHIAAMLATDERYLAAAGGGPDWLCGMIGLAGPYDFLPLRDDDLRDMFGPPERFAASQPVNFVDGNEPPMLLLHGRSDFVVRPSNTQSLAARVRSAGGAVTTHFYATKGHIDIVAALARPLRFTGRTLEDIERFVSSTCDHAGPTRAAWQTSVR